MNILERIRSYRMFRNMIVSYITLVAITITILSCVLFSIFSKSVLQEVENRTNVTLRQDSYALDSLENKMVTINNQLILDNDVSNYVYRSYTGEADKVEDYEMYLKMRSIQSTYSMIKDIGIYVFSGDKFIDTMGFSVNTSSIAQNTEKSMSFYSWDAFSGSVDNQLLTFVFYTNNRCNKSLRYAIVISVDQKYLVSTANEISGSQQDTSVFVLNSEGRIISHNDTDLFLKNLSGSSYVHAILSSKDNEGSFINYGDKGEKELITFVRTNNILNLYFVSVKSYDKMIANINSLRQTTIFIASLLLLLGVLISLYVTGYLYKPLRGLIDKIGKMNNSGTGSKKIDEYKIISESFEKSLKMEKSMESIVYKSTKDVKQNYLLALIKGTNSQTAPSAKEAVSIDGQLTGPLFQIILLKIDHFQALKNNSKSGDLALIRYAITNIAQELFLSVGKNDAVVVEESEMVLLLQTQEEPEKGEILAAIQKLQQIIEENFEISLSSSIGSVVTSKDEIYLSYRSAAEYIKYRLFYGDKCVIDAYLANKHQTNNANYSYLSEKKLLEALYAYDFDEVLERIHEFIQSINIAPYYQVIAYCSQLIITIYRDFEVSNSFPVNHVETILKIENSETLVEISEIISEFCRILLDYLVEKHSRNADEKYKLIVNKIQNYILENYSDSGLSLDVISEIVDLTPGYVGKIFKSYTGESFNEYISNIRLEKARFLLVSTEKPIFKICEEVGIYNVTYFSTLFKKAYSLTPSQFREQSNSTRNEKGMD